MTLYVTVPEPNIWAYDATVKPRADVGYFLNKNMDNVKLFSLPMFTSESWTKLKMDALLAKCSLLLTKQDQVLFQLPMYTKSYLQQALIDLCKQRGVKCIGLVHDIDCLRGLVSNPLDEFTMLNQMDMVTLPSMRLFKLLNHQSILGKTPLTAPVVIQDYPWDYKMEPHHDPRVRTQTSLGLVYAGNLSGNKASFLRGLQVPLAVYGRTDSATQFSQRCVYMGTVNPKDSLSVISNYTVGLVWDGDFQNNEELGYHSYEKYNWSHKFSLYLASGLPVIVPEGTQVGDFVKEHHLGITLDSLDGLGEAYQLTDWHQFDKDIKVIQDKLLVGYSITHTIKLAQALLKYHN